ncbi:reverse transcriptase domain-containing protein [Tanacetum coccineum]
MTVSHDVAYAMTWADLRKKITDKYCPRNEMNKLEAELWNLKLKGTDMIRVQPKFPGTTLCCVLGSFLRILRQRLKGTSRIARHEPWKYCSIKARKTMQEAVEIATEQMDKKVQHHCLSAGNVNNANNQRGTRSGQKPTCFECGVQGYFKRECPKLKNNKNRGNQVGNDRALAKLYAVGHAGTNPDSNVMTGTFLLNNRYASILIDTGADKSFVSRI